MRSVCVIILYNLVYYIIYTLRATVFAGAAIANPRSMLEPTKAAPAPTYIYVF